MGSPFALMPAGAQHEIVQQIEVLRITAIVLLSIAFVSVVLRVYVRAKLIRGFGYDDWFMLLSYVR